MIIAKALEEVLKDILIQYQYNFEFVEAVSQFHFGSQLELNKWIIDKNNRQLKKYPLIWYVLEKSNDVKGMQGYKETYARLILFQATDKFWFNDQRTAETYLKVLEPLFEKIKERLLSNPYISIITENGYKQFEDLDFPNYGTEQEFNGSKGEKITLDPVDAKVIEFHLRINPHCIIK